MATEKKVNDKSEIGGSFLRRGFGETVTIYSFYSKKKSKKRIIIAALTFLDAIELLKAFNPWYELEYNVNEYKEEFVETWIYMNICNIPVEHKFTQRFISEKEYTELAPYIDNKGWANTHHTKTLTQNNNKKIFGNESEWIDFNVNFKDTIREMTKANAEARVNINEYCKKHDLIYKEGSLKCGNFSNIIILGTDRDAINKKIDEYNKMYENYSVYYKIVPQGKEQFLFNNLNEIDMNDVRIWNKISKYLPDKNENNWAKIFRVNQISNLAYSEFREEKTIKDMQEKEE